MSALNTQTQLDIENFDMTLVSASVKKLMASIKGQYDQNVKKEEDKIKGAGGSSDLWKVPVDAIKVLPGFNVRLPGEDLEKHLEFLTESILEDGFYQTRPLSALALEVNGEMGLYVYDGHCRLEAAKRAVAKGATVELLPVVVTDGRGVDLDDLNVQVFRLNQGKQLAPFELGLLCKRLHKNGHSDESIAKRMGIKAQYVDGLLRLVSAPKPLVDAVLTDEMSASEAIKMIRQVGNGKVVEELESRRARALAEYNAKNGTAVVASTESATVSTAETNNDGQQAAEPAPAKVVRPRLTARHAGDANIKKAVKKHGMDLFQASRELKADPAYASLSAESREKLEAILAQMEQAEKADALPPKDDEQNGEGDQA